MTCRNDCTFVHDAVMACGRMWYAPPPPPPPVSTRVFVAPKIGGRLSDPLVTMGVFPHRSATNAVGRLSPLPGAPHLWRATAGSTLSLIVPFRRACSVALLLRTVNIRMVCCSFWGYLLLRNGSELIISWYAGVVLQRRWSTHENSSKIYYHHSLGRQRQCKTRHVPFLNWAGNVARICASFYSSLIPCAVTQKGQRPLRTEF
jgi:hypothetical protein